MTLGSATTVRRVQLSVALALAGFAATTLAVSFGATAEFDRELVLMLRNPANLSDALGPPWFEEAAAEFTALGGYTILTTLGIIAFVTLWLLHKPTAAFFLVAAVGSGTLVSTLMKQAFARPRPDVVEHMDRVFTSSFPSGHSMVGMLAWLTLAAVIVRFVPRHALRVFVMTTALAMGILIGLSRVYLGVHWPTDVLAGWCLGIAWAGICWLTAHYLNARKGVAPELGR